MVKDVPLFSSSFLFMRHGQTASNAQDLVAGSLDVPLSPEGERQAAAAAERLACFDFSAIWTSRLRRARRTAEIVAAVCRRPVTCVSELAERDWGAWEGQPRSVLVREASPPGGESPEVFAGRIRAGLARIEPPFPVLIVAHSGTARVIEALLSGEAQPFRRLANAEIMQWSKARDGTWSRGEPDSREADARLSSNCQASGIDEGETPQS